MGKSLRLSKRQCTKALKLFHQAALKSDRRGERRDLSDGTVRMTWKSGHYTIVSTVTFFRASYYQTAQVRVDGQLVFSADFQQTDLRGVFTYRPGSWERWLLKNPVVPERKQSSLRG